MRARRAICGLGLFFFLLLPSLAQELTTRVFVLNARPAESTIEMVRPLLSPEGKAFPDSRLNQLIVRDTPEVLAEVENLLKQIDRHAPQVRFFVQMNGVARSEAGLATVGVSSGGRRVGISGTAGSVQTQSTQQSEQNLVVMSGERGVIHFARDVVNVNPYVGLAVSAGLLPPQAVFQTVGTGFAVEPVVVGEVVRFKVTPWMSFQGADGASEVMISEASSSFAVPSGQTVTVTSGGYENALQSQSFGLIFGSASRTSSGTASVTIRPEILDY